MKVEEDLSHRDRRREPGSHGTQQWSDAAAGPGAPGVTHRQLRQGPDPPSEPPAGTSLAAGFWPPEWGEIQWCVQSTQFGTFCYIGLRTLIPTSTELIFF